MSIRDANVCFHLRPSINWSAKLIWKWHNNKLFIPMYWQHTHSRNWIKPKRNDISFNGFSVPELPKLSYPFPSSSQWSKLASIAISYHRDSNISCICQLWPQVTIRWFDIDFLVQVFVSWSFQLAPFLLPQTSTIIGSSHPNFHISLAFSHSQHFLFVWRSMKHVKKPHVINVKL